MRFTISILLVIMISFFSCDDDSAEYSVTYCGDKLIENNHSVEGYTDKLSYLPGESVNIKAHCLSDSFKLEIIKIGIENELLFSENSISGMKQNYTTCSYQYGCDWQTTYSFTVPNNWKSGWYVAKLIDGSKDFHITFILKPSNSENDIALIASSNTWQAYNLWGGASFYDFTLSENPQNRTYSSMVSFERPNPRALPFGEEGHCANAEQHILKWLVKNDYNFDIYADIDLHNANILRNYKAVIISTHSEYWTKSMYDNLIDYMNKGGNLLYLSGNGIYWKVTIRGNQMEYQKNNGLHTHSGEKGGKWRDLGHSESSLLGVKYTPSGYRTYAGYSIKQADHWIFNNTNLTNGDVIGEKGLNYGGASGWETDKRDSKTPSKAILLAKGLNPDNGGAEMVYYNHSGGGAVFSVGSITYGGSLAIDPNLTIMTKNVLNKFIE